MDKEYGLFILWENSRYKEDNILEDIKKRFEIINIFNVSWNREKFSKNLSRFYGENLPKKSYKEKECGLGSFLLIIVEDIDPVYLNRKTSKGMKKVNVNFFDAKEMYRKWTGGGHKVHSSNDLLEFKHDLMMLLGVNVEDYFKIYKKSVEIINISNNIIGDSGWESLQQIFYVLNESIEYVVLRNFELLPDTYQIGEHGDIDILCNNYYNICSILNSESVSKQKSRVRNKIKINDEIVYFDFRFVGDGYYDRKWEENILLNRVKNKCFYIPNEIDFKYSLLYHALIHKRKISSDYIKKFKFMFDENDNYNLILKLFLEEKKYEIINPMDISVFFNEVNSNKKNRILKKMYFNFYPILRKLKLN